MSVQQRRQYDPESKRNKVLLTKEPNRSVRDVAESPGISPDQLYQWRQQHRDQGEIAFPGQGNLALTPDQKRIRTVCGKLTECGLTPCPPLWRKLNSNVHTAINPRLNELMPGIS